MENLLKSFAIVVVLTMAWGCQQSSPTESATSDRNSSPSTSDGQVRQVEKGDEVAQQKEPSPTEPSSTEASPTEPSPTGSLSAEPSSTESPEVESTKGQRADVATPESAKPFRTLTIGDLAPPLVIDQWVLGDAFDKFEPNQVYVIEFWATWCPPCRTSMPHLSQLQEKYGDQVRFVGVTRESVEVVRSFLEQEQSDNKTWEQVVTYRLATDLDEAMHEAYMRAAEQAGIPTAFIVGTDGIIEWIGHPMAMEASLEKIVAGNWDREAAIAEIEKERQREQISQELGALVQSSKWDQALERIEQLEAEDGDYPDLAAMKAHVLYYRANQLVEDGQTELAVKDYAKVVELDPKLELGFYSLAYSLKDLERYAEAAKAYQRATELRPNIRNFVGWFESLREDGDLEAALNVVDQFVERYPLRPRTQRFDLLSRLRRWDRAAADVNHIPVTRQRLATPWWVLGPVAEPWADEASIETELRSWIAGKDDVASARWYPQKQATEAQLHLLFPDAKPEERFCYVVTRVFARDAHQVLVRASGPVSRLWSLRPKEDLQTHEFVKTQESEPEALMELHGGWNTLLVEVPLQSVDGRCDVQIVFARGSSDPVQAVVVPGATWRFLHPVNGEDPAQEDPDFHETFFLPDYDDAHWKNGVDQPGVMGGFGYGDPVGVDIGKPSKGQRYSAYFRHAFDSPCELEDLVIRLQRDDGVIVYLNGEEVGHDNIAPDAVDSYRLGTAEYGPNGSEETQLRVVRLEGRVVKGRNVLAVSLHNSSPRSSDMRFGEVTLEGRRPPE